MKTKSIFYLLGVIFILLGLSIKIPAFIFTEHFIFLIGLVFSSIGIIFLFISARKNKSIKDNSNDIN